MSYFFKREGDDSFVRLICFPFLDQFFLFLALKKFTVAIMNQMAMIPEKNPSSDLNSPGGDVV